MPDPLPTDEEAARAIQQDPEGVLLDAAAVEAHMTPALRLAYAKWHEGNDAMRKALAGIPQPVQGF